MAEDEFGYSSLKEMESVRGFGGLGIERDLYWTPTAIRDISSLKKFVRED